MNTSFEKSKKSLVAFGRENAEVLKMCDIPGKFIELN